MVLRQRLTCGIHHVFRLQAGKHFIHKFPTFYFCNTKIMVEHPVWAEKTIYVGPMGCRTGMYVIFKGDLEPQDVAAVIRYPLVK